MRAKFWVDVMQAAIPLLASFEKAEVEGVCVSDAVNDRGRADLRRMGDGRLIARRLSRSVIVCPQPLWMPSVPEAAMEITHCVGRRSDRQVGRLPQGLTELIVADGPQFLVEKPHPLLSSFHLAAPGVFRIVSATFAEAFPGCCCTETHHLW
jgi:hypothetical protein